ncbi:MAG: hypothetical protein NT146_10365 [Mycobacterium sp.]|nr:hypothetical protein [Mycobacterium sp.]
MKPRLVFVAALCCLVAIAGLLIANRSDDREAQPTVAAPSELHDLDEAMLIDESAVPPLEGTTWGRMVAVPRGAEPPVVPASCVLFLSQGTAAEKGLAMRSSKNASIGVTLSVGVPRPDLPALVDECKVFTFEGAGASSRVELAPMPVADLPDGAISTLMHCRTDKADQTLVWDIALIVGYHRGVLVTAEYTPGPQGGAFDSGLASRLGEVYRAQIRKLDA